MVGAASIRAWGPGMNSVKDSASWRAACPGLAGLAPETARLVDDLNPVDVEAGAALFSPGAACQGFVVVLSGGVRVTLTSESGRSLLLYRVGPGETCVQTTLCLMAGRDYSAEGVTEKPTRILVIPRARFEALMQAADFRAFVFERFGARLDDMTRVLETIAFTRIDARLARALIARADARGEVAATHQELADDIGSAREVVSRQLKTFAQDGLIEAGRGAIHLRDAAALAALARVT